jgi:hypothetical protein
MEIGGMLKNKGSGKSLPQIIFTAAEILTPRARATKKGSGPIVPDNLAACSRIELRVTSFCYLLVSTSLSR